MRFRERDVIGITEGFSDKEEIILYGTFDRQSDGNWSKLNSRQKGSFNGCKSFLGGLIFNLTIGMLKYKNTGCVTNWVDIFCVSEVTTTYNGELIQAVAVALRDASSLISRSHNPDTIA